MYIIYIKYHQVEIIFYILRRIMQVKLDNYEKDIDDNFFNQESITNSKIQIDSFKQSAIKHLKTKRPVTTVLLIMILKQ